MTELHAAAWDRPNDDPSLRWVSPPGWTPQAPGWSPPEGWRPNASWPAAPFAWSFWLVQTPDGAWDAIPQHSSTMCPKQTPTVGVFPVEQSPTPTQDVDAMPNVSSAPFAGLDKFRAPRVEVTSESTAAVHVHANHGMRWNRPPGWPVTPTDWSPPSGWEPDPAWPPAPYGWPLWLPESDVDEAGGSVDKSTAATRSEPFPPPGLDAASPPRHFPTTFCRACGRPVDPRAVVCPYDGVAQQQIPQGGASSRPHPKSMGLAIFLNLLFPGAGHIYAGIAHKSIGFLVASSISFVLYLAARAPSDRVAALVIGGIAFLLSINGAVRAVNDHNAPLKPPQLH